MTATAECWRLIDTGACDGALNMAVDEALLQQFDPATSQPILRLYGWEPAALSLGRFQKAEELDLSRVEADQRTVVRRITGGGVIYHRNELTYALVCAPRHIPRATSIKESFRMLTSFLHAFYRTLGLPSTYAVDTANQAERLGERCAFCFAGKESYDILINGRKIGGNAQRRLKGVIFQHGSIPLHNHVTEGLAYLNTKPAGLAASTSCLVDEQVRLDLTELKAILAEAFRSQMAATTVPDRLTSAEQVLAERLVCKKYSSRQWNLEGKTP